MKDIKLLLIGVILAICLCLGGFNLAKTYGYEEVCIAEQCTEWAVGEDWIKDNCNLNESNQYDYCDIKINEEMHKIALEDIDLTKARSCRESECFTKIRVKKLGGLE